MRSDLHEHTHANQTTTHSWLSPPPHVFDVSQDSPVFSRLHTTQLYPPPFCLEPITAELSPVLRVLQHSQYYFLTQSSTILPVCIAARNSEKFNKVKVFIIHEPL